MSDEMSKPPGHYGAPLTFGVVALGTSLGGLEALRNILSTLPADFPAPLVIVQHISPRYPSYLPELLSHCTSLHVIAATDGQRLCNGNVYVAPPNRHLLVNPDHTLTLADSPRIKFSRPALDPLFSSVAIAFGAHSIGVILTGGNSDGAEGICAIRRMGGTTIAQDRETSRAFRMPLTAINTGCIDFVLPIQKIAPMLRVLVLSFR